MDPSCTLLSVPFFNVDQLNSFIVLKLQGSSTTTPSQLKEEPTKDVHKIKKLGFDQEVNKVNPKVDPIVKEKNETKILEKQQYQEGVSALNSLTTMNSLQSAISQKEADMDYKPYSYLFDYLYEPTQMEFLEESNSDPIRSQTSVLTHQDQDQDELDIIDEEEQEEEEEEKGRQEQPQPVVLSEHIHEPTLSKKEEYLKSETFPKTEYYQIKKELSGVKSEYYQKGDSFTYILSDDDDDVIFEGNQKRKAKLEEEDVKGTFLEGVTDLDKINTNQGGEVSELKDFKTYRPSNRKTEHKKEEGSKPQKEQILLCQPESKTNLNIHLTDELERLLKIYQIQKDKGRV